MSEIKFEIVEAIKSPNPRGAVPKFTLDLVETAKAHPDQILKINLADQTELANNRNLISLASYVRIAFNRLNDTEGVTLRVTQVKTGNPVLYITYKTPKGN